MFLLFLEEISVIVKCGQLSTVQVQEFTNFGVFMYIMLLYLVHK